MHGRLPVFTRFFQSGAWRLVLLSYTLALVGGLGLTLWQEVQSKKALVAEVQDASATLTTLSETARQFEQLKQEDQVTKNASLSAELTSLTRVYQDGEQLFERRADLVASQAKTKEIDVALAHFLGFLADKNYIGAASQSAVVDKLIDKTLVAAVPAVPAAAAAPSNALPADGYSRQKVSTPRGEFVISMVVATGVRAMVETASESDCMDNCPTKSLAEHVAAAGGFAGINGAYFCPPDYPRCQGKTNSFDTLAVSGRTHAVLNRANNVYSTVPLVAFYGTRISFYDRTVDWGIDTSSQGALANHPRLLRGGSVATEDASGKGTRGFVAQKDDRIVIGHVYAASLADTAEVLRTLGLSDALNLDGGGSSALWYQGGYKAGPGRGLPTAIVLVK